MVDAPEDIMNDPYVEGWLLKVEVADTVGFDEGMTALIYREMVEGA